MAENISTDDIDETKTGDEVITDNETTTNDETPTDDIGKDTDTLLAKVGEKDEAKTEEEKQDDIEYDFTEIFGGASNIDEQKLTEISDILKTAGVQADKANDIVKYGVEYASEVAKYAQEQQELKHIEQVETWGKETKEKLGKDLNATMQKCGVAIERISKDIPNIREVLNETGVGNRLEMVKVFSLLGELLSEDYGHGTGNKAVQPKSFYDKTDFSKY